MSAHDDYEAPWPTLEPYDEHNCALHEAVHPPDWQNPRPEGRYNFVVLGAGTAGLVAAPGAAGLGARVALVERGLMGGELVLAMERGVGLNDLASVIHPYPTQAEVIKRAADEHQRTRLTPRRKKLLRWFLGLRR